jgi:hypothetical protein
MQSAIFLSQRKMKNEAMLLVVSAKAPIFQFRRSGEPGCVKSGCAGVGRNGSFDSGA